MEVSKARLLFPDNGEPERRHRKPNWIAERSGLGGHGSTGSALRIRLTITLRTAMFSL
jgi:hypothetical protein